MDRPDTGPCPALTTDGCGIVLFPEMYDPVRTHRYGKTRMTEAAKLLIGAGVACDAKFEHEELDEAVRDELLAYARSIPGETLDKAMEAWGI